MSQFTLNPRIPEIECCETVHEARKSKTSTDNIPHVPSLEGNDGIPQDESHPVRNAPLRIQKHQEHARLHSARNLLNRTLRLQSCRDERRGQCSDRSRL